MRRLLIAPFLFLMLAFPACNGVDVVPQTPREVLAAAEVTFTNLVDEVGFQIKAGTISKEQVEKLRPFAVSVRLALDSAQAAIANGQPATDAISAVQAALRALQIELAKAKGN